MKINQIFTYDEGPFYDPKEVVDILGVDNQMIEEMVLKVTQYEKRRLLSLDTLQDTPLTDAEFIQRLEAGMGTMARSLIDQYRSWQASTKQKIQSLTIINSQGIPTPEFIESIKQRLELGAVPVYHLTGMNCPSTFIATQHLNQLRKTDPLRKDECDLVLAIEVPSSTLRRNRDLLPLEHTLYDFVVSDGAALMVLGADEGCEGLKITGHRNFYLPRIQYTLNSRAIGKQVEHGILPELRDDLENVMNSFAQSALQDLGLSFEQIRHWVCHPGAVQIVDCICSALGLEKQVMNHGRNTIRSLGNTMSSLILYTLKRYFDANEIKRDDFCFLMGFGPGIEIQTLTTQYL